MDATHLEKTYRDYLACLNARDWARLGDFLDDRVVHNGNALGVRGYRKLVEGNYADIPDLYFKIELLAVQPPRVAARLMFDVMPTGEFLGLAVTGRRIRFAENVFYAFDNGRIREVWSVLDKVAIEAQLAR